MNVQFVRLEDDICEPLNQMALQQRRAVSELVNQVLREFLNHKAGEPANPDDRAHSSHQVG